MKKLKAFTLIELLVIIAVIAILCAIIIPTCFSSKASLGVPDSIASDYVTRMYPGWEIVSSSRKSVGIGIVDWDISIRNANGDTKIVLLNCYDNSCTARPFVGSQ